MSCVFAFVITDNQFINRQMRGHTRHKKLALMRKFLFAIMLMVWGIAAHAVDYVGILVTLVDGTTATVSFDEKPIIKFQPDKLVVQTDVATTEFNRANVARFNYITEDLSGIDVIAHEQAQIKNNGDALYFNNLPTGSEIMLYSTEGKLLKQCAAIGNYTINITDLPSGIYIVSVNGISTKIVKQP